MNVARSIRLVSWLGLLMLSGCGGSGVGVHGEVTYEGQLVEKGTITFLPADGKGQPAGAAITNGKYNLDAITPGPKVVKIEASKEQAVPLRREEAMKNAAAARDKSAPGGDSGKRIPSNAEGNNRKVDIAPGQQKLDFHLTKPASRQK